MSLDNISDARADGKALIERDLARPASETVAPFCEPRVTRMFRRSPSVITIGHWPHEGDSQGAEGPSHSPGGDSLSGARRSALRRVGSPLPTIGSADGDLGAGA